MQAKYIKWILFIALLLILLGASMLLSLSFGEINISIFELPNILNSHSGLEYTIISQIRLPRMLMGLAVGGALSLAGVILQGIYRNPLVEPYTMGISGGAALGVSITIVFHLQILIGNYILPISGFVGAITTMILVYFLSMNRKSANINGMLLIGVMISFITSSSMMFLMATTTSENIHSIVFWIMGSLDEPDLLLLRIAIFTSMSGLLLSYFFARPLNALRLGETQANHLGINSRLVIRLLFLIASLLTGICVSVSGVIGFVGLIIPHFVRMVVGSDFRILFISSFLSGSIFLILSDLLARTIISPNELPIGVITGIVGGVLFIVIFSKFVLKKSFH